MAFDARLAARCHDGALSSPAPAANMGGLGCDLPHPPGARPFPGGAWCATPVHLKLAQAGNPEGYLFGGVRRTFMNWNTRDTFERGVEYAKKLGGRTRRTAKARSRLKRSCSGRSSGTLRKNDDADLDPHADLPGGVGDPDSIGRPEDLKLPVFIDHGTFDGHRAAPLSGRSWACTRSSGRGTRWTCPTGTFIRWSPARTPRSMQAASPPATKKRAMDPMIGFNTDSLR